MPRRRSASSQGLKPHYKVRVVLPGAMLHLAAWDEPHRGEDFEGRAAWVASWIKDPRYGDAIGWIDWSKLRAITWRWSE
jgi:hypothetical protein